VIAQYKNDFSRQHFSLNIGSEVLRLQDFAQIILKIFWGGGKPAGPPFHMTTFIDLILIKNFIPEFIICHFSLLCYMPLIKSPKQRLETYWFCSVSYYYYMHPDCCRVMYCYSMFLFQYYYYYSTHFCPFDFSEMPWSNIMKPCRNIICHVKLVF
jgi:hypothetical protein